MQCPNCKMNISDTAKWCIHCGVQFNQLFGIPGTCPNCKSEVGPYDQFCIKCGCSLQNQEALKNGPAIKEAPNKEAYFRAFFGKNYDHNMTSSVSLGVIFLGWFWFAFHRLYSDAGKMILSRIGLVIAIGILSIILGNSFVSSIIIAILTLVGYFYILIVYAKAYPKDYYNMADRKIDGILKDTTDEEKRINLCKKAGKPNYILLIVVLLFYFSYPLIAVIGALSVINNEEYYIYQNKGAEYINAVRDSVLTHELDCGGDINNLPQGIYYYSFTTANGNTARDLFSGTLNIQEGKNHSGQVYIFKTMDFSERIAYEYAVVIADEDGNGIGEFDSNGKPLKVTSMKRLESPTLIKKDKKNIINRKIFYEKTASGTNEDLNVLAAPTLETKWDDKSFADMLNESSLQANSTPIACTLKS